MKKIAFILAALGTAATALAASPEIKIYVPRSLQVQSSVLTLGEICVIRCDDEAVLRKVSAVAMGRGPFFKESLSLGRQAILSRLGASGVDTANVLFTGAQAVTLESKDKAMAAEQLIHAAQEFIVQRKPLPEDRVWQLVRQPVEVTLTDTEGVQLIARLAKQDPDPRQVRVEVVLTRQNKDLAVAEMTFRADYLARQVIASKDIPAHARITEDCFKVRLVVAQTKPVEWVSPLGMETPVAIEKGKMILTGQLIMPKLEVIVHRDQKVKMKVEGLGFVITGIGQAMDNGRPGDVIRVMNADSQQVVACTVATDGTVHPMYDEEKK